MSTNGVAQPRSTLGDRLRRVTWPRVGFMVAILALALVLTRVLGRTSPRIKDDRAVAIARSKLDFKPQGMTVRLVRRGLPPRGYWAVSFWKRNPSGSGYSRITLVLVDSSSGAISEVRRTP